MPIDQPPAIFHPAESGSSKVWTPNDWYISQQPTKLVIGDLVEIDLKDGSMKFRDGYSPDAAARTLWEAISSEYREMQKWKAEQRR